MCFPRTGSASVDPQLYKGIRIPGFFEGIRARDSSIEEARGAIKRGLAKVQLALAEGKHHYDKREATKARDWGRQKARLMREKG